MRGLFKKKKFDVEAFIAGCVDSLRLMNTDHRKNWNLGKEKSWKVDEKVCRIRFSFANGTEVSAPVQVVGTYDAKEGTFTWAWDHPMVIRKLQKHAAQVKSFGEEIRCAELTKSKLASTEKRAWEYTALAMQLSEAHGAYRAQIMPDTFVFMTFGEVEVIAAA
jgi:hypothetical protein